MCDQEKNNKKEVVTKRKRTQSYLGEDVRGHNTYNVLAVVEKMQKRGTCYRLLLG